MESDFDRVRQLAELLDATRLTKVEVSQGKRRVRIVRHPLSVVTDAAETGIIADVEALAYSTPAAAVATQDPAVPSESLIVRSPLVGTAHLADRHNAEPFMSVGGKMMAGDTLLLLEVMKTKIPIVASRGGCVVAVQVEDGRAVEFDQPLVVIA